MLKKIFGPMRDEATGKWRELHNAELNDLHFSPNNTRVIRSIIMKWAAHVARMGDRILAYSVSIDTCNGNHL